MTHVYLNRKKYLYSVDTVNSVNCASLCLTGHLLLNKHNLCI